MGMQFYVIILILLWYFKKKLYSTNFIIHWLRAGRGRKNKFCGPGRVWNFGPVDTSILDIAPPMTAADESPYCSHAEQHAVWWKNTINLLCRMPLRHTSMTPRHTAIMTSVFTPLTFGKCALDRALATSINYGSSACYGKFDVIYNVCLMALIRYTDTVLVLFNASSNVLDTSKLT